MTRRLAAAIGAAAAVAVMAMPAALGQGAQDKPTGVPLTMPPEQRDPQGVVVQQGATVSGQFTMSAPQFQGVVEEIDAAVTSLANPPVPVPDPYNVCTQQGATVACGQQSVAFTSPLPGLAFNGPYRVTAWAYGSDFFVSHARSDDVTLPGDFKLAVPPRAPQNVKAQYDAPSRFVVVTWDRNPEPDVRQYVVQHKGPGDKEFKVIGAIGQPPGGSQVAIAEHVPAGDYQYQVDAWRAGADPTDPKQNVDSGFAPQPPAAVSVPVPPPGTTKPGTAPPAPGLKPVNKSQLPKPRSSSSGARSSSSGATTLTTQSVSPDGGFARGPADVTSTIPGGGDDSGRAVALLPKSKGDSSGRLAIFGPVAGGAVLFVLAFHLRYLKSRLDEAPPIN